MFSDDLRMRPVSIVLVDDHPIVRAGFRQLLDLEPGWRVVAEAGSAEALGAVMLQTQFDVLILDLSLPDADGLVLIRHLLVQRPTLPIVVLSMHDGALYVNDALVAGAKGYVTKRSAPDEIITAVRAVSDGGTYVSMDLQQRTSVSDSTVETLVPELTAREAQVLLLLARGHSVARVAATIGVNPKTAYAHRANIYAKLGIATDHEMRQFAYRRGLVPTG